MNNFTEIHCLKDFKDIDREIWIYPVGNISDILILNSVLCAFSNKYTNRKFKMVKRSNCLNYFEKNPAIIDFGYPPKGSIILKTDYWNHNEYEKKKPKPFQALAKMFALDLPIEEKIFIQYKIKTNNELENIIPWNKNNIIIAPFVESPNFVMHPLKWHKIVENLTKDDTLIIQVGKVNHIHIKGTYSLLGLTDFSSLISILKKINLIITSDNYLIHLSNCFNIPAVILLGPVSGKAQTYKNQYIINASPNDSEKCIECGKNYHNIENIFECPFDVSEKCINSINENHVCNIVSSFLY